MNESMILACSHDGMRPCAMQLIRDVMSKGQAAGLNVIRAWATSASPYYALQTSPGNFSEPIFRGLDYALDQARQQNLKACFLITILAVGLLLWGVELLLWGAELLLWGAELLLWGAELLLWGAELLLWGVELLLWGHMPADL